MRIGVDTNILLRAMLNDEPVQSAAARRFLTSLHDENSGYVSANAVLELFWVLRSRYKLPRDLIVQTVGEMMTIASLEFESFDALRRALFRYAEGGCDFPDAFIAERNLDAGCSRTMTLDQKAAARIPAMELLS